MAFYGYPDRGRGKAGKKMRESGLKIIGQLPWGVHLCQFYQTREDLTDLLVPYFKAGLDNNESCVWVTSEPLETKDAEASLRKTVKNLDHYIKREQIQILGFKEWYIKSGAFNNDEVLRIWVREEEHAIKKGFDGFRFAGNASWLEKKDWKSFINHETIMSEVISKYNILTVCSYPIDSYEPSDLIDIAYNHQFAVMRTAGSWKIANNSLYMKLAKDIKSWEALLERFNKISIEEKSEIAELKKRVAELGQRPKRR